MVTRNMQRLAGPFRSERGITGLETAIILIAFVVVASVFSYTVLTAGVFASQKSNESVNASIDEVRSLITIKGNTLAYKGSVDIDGVASTTADAVEAVVRISMQLASAPAGLPIDLTPPYQVNATNKSLEPSTKSNSLIINYVDSTQVINDMAFTVEFTGNNDGDDSLEPTERAVVSVWLVEYDYDTAQGLWFNLGADDTDPFIDTEAELLKNFDLFSLELSPVQGAPLILEKVVPQSLNDIMNLR